ncbi:MAG TPA: energy transducer TonB [Pseudomonadales bacterium]
MLLRLPLTVLFGFAFTATVFWVLWRLVSVPIDVERMAEATRIEFTQMRRDTEAQTKRQEQPERQPPPPVPEVPQMAFASGGVSNNIVALTPNLDPRGAMSKLTLSAGTDTDVIPLVRIAPQYPPRALRRGVEGWVIVQFTITETGAVKDPIVVDADPKGLFEDAALEAILRWRYNPRVEGGVAVARVGVQTKITFALEED